MLFGCNRSRTCCLWRKCGGRIFVVQQFFILQQQFFEFIQQFFVQQLFQFVFVEQLIIKLRQCRYLYSAEFPGCHSAAQ